MTQDTDRLERAETAATIPGRYTLLGLLWLTYMFSVIDRYVMGILVEPIKRDLHLSDSMMGFLSGTVFGLFYATLAIPVAMLADRRNRRNLVAASLFIWSICTILCGMAAGAVQMAMARVFVGVGEAGSTPPAQSLIADLFPPRERGKAAGLFASGGSLGIVLAFSLSGLIAGHWGWRWAFILMGAPGALLAVVMMAITKEPVRGLTDPSATEGDRAPSLGKVLKFITGTSGLLHLIAAVTLVVASSSLLALWVPAYMIRNFQVGAAQVGPALGLIIGVGGGVGTIGVGWLSDRLARQNPSRRVLIGGIIQVAVWPFMIGVLQSKSYVAALFLMVVPGVLSFAPLALSWTILQNLTPPRMRATVVGIGVLAANIGALVIAPQAIGFLSDLLATGDAGTGLRRALLLAGLLYPWAAWHYIMATRRLKTGREG